MNTYQNPKKNTKSLKEESKKMNEKLMHLRALMDLDADKKKINQKFSKNSSKWKAGSNVGTK